MGHQRIGTLPDTRPWRKLVEAVAENGGAGEVAAATTGAAVNGLNKARNDPGLVEGVVLLSRLVLAARGSDFAGALGDAGLPIGPDPGLFEVVSGFSEALDGRLRAKASRTDIGEMAQQAGVETLTALLRSGAEGLYGADPADVQRAARDLSTQKGFGTLAHEFFARFTQRFLTYHLGRELSQHVGGNGRFADPAEHDAFVEGLAIHCREACAIMREFAGDWYSKANFKGGVTTSKARGFVAHALDKVRRELETRGAHHV
jgi:hypothetical protein